MITETEAIVLDSRKHGDTSKIIHAFTPEMGKISLLAKGALQPKSKFGSSLDPLSLSMLTFYKKSATDLHLLSKSELLTPLRKIHSSYEHIAAGLMIMEAISLTQVAAVPNPELYELGRSLLMKLNTLPACPNTVFIFFMIRLSALMGYGLNFDYVHKGPDCTLYYSPEEGAVIGHGGARPRGAVAIDSEAYGMMKLIDEGGADAIDNIDTRACSEKIYEFLMSCFGRHLDRPISLRSHNLLMV